MHISKVKNGGGWTQLKGHMERDHEFYKNNVDLSKSHQNITIKDYMTEQDILDHIRDAGVTRKIRSDAVVALNIVCTVPKEEEHYPGDLRDWGERVIQGTCRSLGVDLDHVAGAEIHVDETSPHIHFSLIPITENGGKVKLSAKDIVTQERLQHLHDDLQTYMHECGYTGQYVNADRDDRGLGKDALPELKRRERLQANLKDLRAEVAMAEIDIGNLIERSEALEKQCDTKQQELKNLNEQINSKKTALQRLELDFKAFYDKVEEMLTRMTDGLKKGIDEHQVPIIEQAREDFTRDYDFGSLNDRFKHAYRESAMTKADGLKDRALQKVRDAGELELTQW